MGYLIRKNIRKIALFLLIGSLLLFTSQTAQSQSKKQMHKDFFYAEMAHGWQMNRPYMYPYYSGHPYWNPWYGRYSGIRPPYAYTPYGHTPYGYSPYGYPPGMYGPWTYPPPPWYGEKESPYASLQVNLAGHLTVLVDPLDAEVRVDGKKIKQIEDLSYQVGLLAGTYKVEARKEGYKPFSKDVEIRAGGGVFLPIQLTKK
jgi:hypothetical protein